MYSILTMFRTHTIRGQDRFIRMRSVPDSVKAIKKITQTQLEFLEKTEVLSIGEKIELLCLLSGNKLTTEIFSAIKYRLLEDGREVPEPHTHILIEDVLKQLPFPYYKDSIQKKNRHHTKIRELSWFQVSSSSSVQDFLHLYPDDLTEFEEGILYGFPVTAIRAFAGLIEASANQPDNVWCYYLGGVFSKEWINQENLYYKQVWEEIRSISPKTVSEAETQYLDLKK